MNIYGVFNKTNLLNCLQEQLVGQIWPADFSFLTLL